MKERTIFLIVLAAFGAGPRDPAGAGPGGRGAPDREAGLFAAIHRVHWSLTAALLPCLGWMISRWFRREELAGRTRATWGLAKQITPLLLGGIVVSGWLMGRGPALALLLAGPALSLPNMLVVNSHLDPKKTVTYVGLVVVMATATGWASGAIWR